MFEHPAGAMPHEIRYRMHLSRSSGRRTPTSAIFSPTREAERAQTVGCLQNLRCGPLMRVLATQPYHQPGSDHATMNHHRTCREVSDMVFRRISIFDNFGLPRPRVTERRSNPKLRHMIIRKFLEIGKIYVCFGIAQDFRKNVVCFWKSELSNPEIGNCSSLIGPGLMRMEVAIVPIAMAQSGCRRRRNSPQSASKPATCRRGYMPRRLHAEEAHDSIAAASIDLGLLLLRLIVGLLAGDPFRRRVT